MQGVGARVGQDVRAHERVGHAHEEASVSLERERFAGGQGVDQPSTVEGQNGGDFERHELAHVFEVGGRPEKVVRGVADFEKAVHVCPEIGVVGLCTNA